AHCPAGPSRLHFFHSLSNRTQRSNNRQGGSMSHHHKRIVKFTWLALASASALALGVFPAAAQYKMTVNKERLLNAQNEPQNWLMMNGDYASQRYSKLTQINRENVKNL